MTSEVTAEPVLRRKDSRRHMFSNAYADERRAASYARLDFPGTYHLAFRDLPLIIAGQALRGRRGLDFGCGAGRSTRFLHQCGFEATGVDISPQMIAEAHRIDPLGDYRLVGEGELQALAGERFDLVLSAFTFDNVPTSALKCAISGQLAGLLAPGGRIIHVVSSPAMYTHEWASFSTSAFPENRSARPGDIVRTIITDTDDARPVDDVLCPDEEYRGIFQAAGLEVVMAVRPLGFADEPYPWVSETRVAPWTIYVLGGGELKTENGQEI
jgi:2-polyprenyl-3-methyl-5-hydroxy-6-metoxy-1,4-benzoquinol methylase